MAFYLDIDQIEITHEYKYLGVDFYSHDYFKPSSIRRIHPSRKKLHYLHLKDFLKYECELYLKQPLTPPHDARSLLPTAS